MARKTASRVRITQVKSGIGSPVKHRRTLRALGIRRHQQSVVHDDTPQIRGMIARIPHLVAVSEVED